jgi:uncharacterized protein YrrD
MRLEPGCAVVCTDAECGEIADVVIDPTTRRVTHVVVEPHHEHGSAHLVPMALVTQSGDRAPVALRCTTKELEALPHVQELAFLRVGDGHVDDPEWDVGLTSVLAMPYYEPLGLDAGMPYVGDTEMIYDRVPKGEVEIQRSSAVEDASHHHLGHVDGFVVDADSAITHVVLERGHLWGRREVTIPISAVASVVNDVVTLKVGRDDVEAMPSVRLHRWHD